MVVLHVKSMGTGETQETLLIFPTIEKASGERHKKEMLVKTDLLTVSVVLLLLVE